MTQSPNSIIRDYFFLSISPPPPIIRYKFKRDVTFEESFRRGETSRIIRIRIVSSRGGVTVINVIVRITMVIRMAICYSNQFSNLFKYESRDETANVIQRYTYLPTNLSGNIGRNVYLET